MKERWVNGLRVQISLFYILASLGTVLLIGFILYYSISSVVLNDALETTTMSVEQSGKHIESYIDKIKDMSLLIASDPSLVRYLSDVGSESDVKDALVMIETALASDASIASIIVVGKKPP